MTLTLSTGEEVSLYALARQMLEDTDEADPRMVAELTLGEIPDDEYDALAFRGWVQVLHEAARAQRVMRRPRQTQGATRSAKWEAVREDQESGALDVMRQRFHTGDKWIMLGDCGASELAAIRDEYEKRARQGAEGRDKFDALLKRLKGSEAEVVADLGPDVVGRILDA